MKIGDVKFSPPFKKICPQNLHILPNQIGYDGRSEARLKLSILS